MKTTSRKCLVCGKLLRIKLYPDRHYRGGHFFNKLKVPIGGGEYKQTGTFKFGRRKFKVVKWTGKEKEVEYWECEKCYQETAHESWLEEKIEALYGKRCNDVEPSCGCCDAWSVYDTIIADRRGKL